MSPLLPVVKLGVSVLASIPVSKIANDIIRNNVTIVTKLDRVKVTTGGLVIGAMVSQSLSKTTDQLVDTAVALKNRIGSDEPAKVTET